MDTNARAMQQRRPAANIHTKSTALEKYLLEKVLSQRKNDFIEDFSYGDIHRDMESTRILPSEKLSIIRTMKFERERIEYLFFLLVCNVGLCPFRNFLVILREKYEWLAERVQLDLDYVHDINLREDTAADDDYHDAIVRLRKEIPKHVDFNVHRCKYVRNKVLHLVAVAPLNIENFVSSYGVCARNCYR